MSSLTWFERESFFSIVTSRPRNVREWQHFGFPIDNEAIYTDIPTPYAEDPDEESFPLPVRRWYGQINDRLFVLDIFYDDCSNECHVQIPYSDCDEFAWQTLHVLQVLPAAIRTNQTIGISNDRESLIRSVLRRDERGFDYPIYNGISDLDVQSLIHFLHLQDSTIGYSLGEPEPNIDWVAKEQIGDLRVQVARYNSRTSALHVACGMSKQSNNEFVVYSESPERDARRYVIRSGNVTNTG